MPVKESGAVRAHRSRRLAAACLTGICLLWMHPSPAEIYRWVDEAGRVHFGDKPSDPGTAAAATPVEVKQAYQPSERSAADAEVYRQEQERILSYQSERAAKERAEKAGQTEARRKELDEICARYAEEVRKFSSLTPGADGRLERHYIEEDGRSVSAERQRELIEGWKAEMARAGCR